jgi:hypothetical protein
LKDGVPLGRKPSQARFTGWVVPQVPKLHLITPCRAFWWFGISGSLDAPFCYAFWGCLFAMLFLGVLLWVLRRFWAFCYGFSSLDT